MTLNADDMSLTRLGARIFAPLPREYMLFIAKFSEETPNGGAPHQ